LKSELKKGVLLDEELNKEIKPAGDVEMTDSSKEESKEGSKP